MTYTMEHINPGARLYFHQELKAELESILNYWAQYSPDLQRGGFYGKIDNENIFRHFFKRSHREEKCEKKINYKEILSQNKFLHH